jgi:hypothetical protein
MLQGAGAPKSSFDSLKNHSTKAQGFVISLTKELFFTQYSQSVLKAKNMNTKLLDGLEMFLGVFVTFLNSSNLQMTGGWHIYRPPSRSSHLEPLLKFLRMHRCIRRYSTGASGHSVPDGIRWEL